MRKRAKVEGLWTTVGPTGIMHWSGVGLHLDKRAAVAKVVARVRRWRNPSAPALTWPQLAKRGYRVIRVNVSEVAS